MQNYRNSWCVRVCVPLCLLTILADVCAQAAMCVTFSLCFWKKDAYVHVKYICINNISKHMATGVYHFCGSERATDQPVISIIHLFLPPYHVSVDPCNLPNQSPFLIPCPHFVCSVKGSPFLSPLCFKLKLASSIVCFSSHEPMQIIALHQCP